MSFSKNMIKYYTLGHFVWFGKFGYFEKANLILDMPLAYSTPNFED